MSGDAVSIKPLNTDEAVAECDRINKSLLQIFDYDGNYRRDIGKDCDKTWFTFTREPKPADKPKKVPNDHPLMKLLAETNDGQLNLTELYKHTRSYDPKKAPDLNLTDSVEITFNGKKIQTTLGRYILNKIVFFPTWNNKYYYFINKPFMPGVLYQEMKYLKQLVFEKKLEAQAIYDIIDASTEFGLRLANIYNSGMTFNVMIPDNKFQEYRKKEIAKVKDQVLKNTDLDLLAETEAKIVDYAKEYYKDDDMIETLDSGSGGSWNGDFKSMNVNVGAVPSIEGKPVLVFDPLIDGVNPKYQADWTNTGLTGATNRALQTAKAGAQYKDITNSMDNVMGIRGDCGSKRGIVVNTSDPLKLFNRYALVNGKPVKITTENVNKFLNKDIVLRDLIYCKEKNGNYCSTCIGDGPFDLKQMDVINIGMMTGDIAQNILNLFMKSTHDLRAGSFLIKDLNDFVVPKPKQPIFEIKEDPIEHVQKVYCTTDLTWKVPLASVTPIDTTYAILAHGSVVSDKDGTEYAFVMGTEVNTKPAEIIQPDVQKEHELERHVIFKYNKGDIFLESVHTARKEMTVYKMINLFLSGNVSNLVPFETHFKTVKNTIATNKKVTINDISIGLILSTLARDADDITKPARETETSNYKFISLYDLLCMSGTFNAVFGPDAVKSIVININKTEKEQTKHISPIEKTLRY